MSAVDALRQRAAKLADQLRDAEAKARAETEAVAVRNADRRQSFWQGVLEHKVPQLQQAVQDARASFTTAVATGGDAPSAYVEYCRAYAESQVVVNATAGELAVYLNDATGEPNKPGDRRGRVQYPAGAQPTHGDPEPFVAMFQAAAAEAAVSHAQAALDTLRGPLVADLEPEAGQP